MRDGVTLRANVYRPAAPGPWPTLLNRTPYGKDDHLEAVVWPGFDPLQAARRGFMVVVQDVRGRFASEGEWDPFAFEAQDGYDSVEWAARLPDSSGRVGMYGGSYHGSTQWLAAIERPPSLAAIAPLMTWSEPMDGVFARGGAVELGLALLWALDTGVDHVGRLATDDADRRRRVAGVIDERDRLVERGYRELPVHEMAPLARHGVRDIGALRALDDPAVAAQCRVEGRHERVAIPALHTAGWYDLFLQGALDNHQALVAQGGKSRLVVGPWTHQQFADPVGEVGFGQRAARAAGVAHTEGSWSDLQLAWLRRQLAASAEPAPSEAPVRIFVMGRNVWRDESAWPLERAVEERWFLRADGSLTPWAPDRDEPASTFAYDPADPVPTTGGHGVLLPGHATGPVDQARVEARDDVLVFTSQPLRDDLEVTGCVRVVLHAESSAPATDWVARLCDVHPDGRSFNLCDGIVRAAAPAGELAAWEIDLWSTSNVFLRGHRLRVQVTSSSFPRWDRNLNTGDQRDDRFEIARQRISHAAERPSFVVLPVVAAPAR